LVVSFPGAYCKAGTVDTAYLQNRTRQHHHPELTQT